MGVKSARKSRESRLEFRRMVAIFLSETRSIITKAFMSPREQKYHLQGVMHGKEQRPTARKDVEHGIQTLAEAMRLVRTLPFGVDLWQVQNVFYMLCHTAYPAFRYSAEQGEPQARTWVHHFRALGDLLSVCVEPT